MKVINKEYYHLIILLCGMSLIFLLYSCKKYGGPVNVNNGNANASIEQVRNVRVENIPGGAHIFYTLPNNKNLLYVKAVYNTKNNGEQEVIASKYVDSLTVRGFANGNPHKVKLYSYGRRSTKSKPKSVTINPLTPTYKDVYNSIKMESIFGGISISFNDNDLKRKLVIVVLNDSSRQISVLNKKHISKQKGNYDLHGFKSKVYKLGYYVRDRYQNISDTSFISLKPLFEELIKGIKFYRFPYDSTSSSGFDYLLIIKILISIVLVNILHFQSRLRWI